MAGFTSEVNRAKVLSAKSLMEPASAEAAGYATVDGKAKVASFAAEIVDSRKPFAVVDPAGHIIGEVSPRRVIDLLAGKERDEAR